MLLKLLGKENEKLSCNEKLLKIGATEISEMEMRAGKEGAHSKRFPENIKIFRALNTPVNISLKKTTIAKETHVASSVLSKGIVFPYVF